MKRLRKNVRMEDISPILTEAIKSGSDVTITVSGKSMFPLWIHGKTNVVLTGCDANFLKKGDIPLYIRDGGQYVLHRIVKVTGDTFSLAGDNQSEVEKGIRKGQIVAVAKGYYTLKGKYIPTDKLSQRLFAKIWILLRPFRRYILAVYRRTVFKLKY